MDINQMMLELDGVQSTRELGRRMCSLGLSGKTHLSLAKEACSRLGLTPTSSTLVYYLWPKNHKMSRVKAQRVTRKQWLERGGKEKVAEWHENTGRERRRIRASERYQNDVPFKLAVVFRTRLRHALCGLAKSDTTLTLVGCSTKELIQYLEAQFQPGMTWANYGEWHVDHIRPVASFDLSDSRQQRACFHFTNLQPLWAEDNFSKGARYDGDI
ncbi:MAG: hypothetical protein JJU07_16485 [Natronohydrobacter sp.]|nr:hypothetical protein [Natronohydrobacter sp.]